MSHPTPQHLELEPRAGDFLELLRDLGHLDDAAMEKLTGQILSQTRPGRVVSFEDARRAAAVYLFDNEANLRPDARELLSQEWARLFS
jgi:hypothetical protein